MTVEDKAAAMAVPRQAGSLIPNRKRGKPVGNHGKANHWKMSNGDTTGLKQSSGMRAGKIADEFRQE